MTLPPFCEGFRISVRQICAGFRNKVLSGLEVSHFHDLHLALGAKQDDEERKKQDDEERKKQDDEERKKQDNEERKKGLIWTEVLFGLIRVRHTGFFNRIQ